MLAVLLISTYWGLGLGLLTALASALAFNFFHIPPTGHFTIADAAELRRPGRLPGRGGDRLERSPNLARSRADEAERAARGGRPGGRPGAPAARRDRPARRPRLRGASLGRGARPAVGGDRAAPTSTAIGGARALPLAVGDEPEATLLVPARDRPGDRSSASASASLPALEALLTAALDRDALQAEVVETQALRHSDSRQDRAAAGRLARPADAADHDRRGQRGGSARRGSAAEEREELAESIGQQAGRLSRLVDQLLDLSRLEAGTADPRREWCSIEELVHSAADEVGDGDVELHARRRPRPAAGQRRRRPARAGARQPARERGGAIRAGIR